MMSELQFNFDINDLLKHASIVTLQGKPVYPSVNAIGPWELNDWTKELMGDKWVKEFNEWSRDNLPFQPALFYLGETFDIFVAHPKIIAEIKKIS